MDVENLDLEGNEKVEPSTSTSQETREEEVTHLNGNDKEDVTGKDGTKEEPAGDDQTNNSSTGELAEGDSIEFEGTKYTVDASGNLVDDKGTIFKEAKDVDAWLKSMDVDDGTKETSGLDIATIQDAIGISVTDDSGNPIEFTNDVEGIKSYLNSVMDLKSKEVQEGAINKLYADNPLLKEFRDYVQLTGTPRGFGDIPDRSGIELDKDNDEQLKAVIRMAAQEFGNKSLNENYLKYLKDSGGLYDEAKAQLEALIEKDKAVRADIEAKAEAQRQAEAQRVKDYWENVNKVINSRIIAGFKLPESFNKEVNGQKVIITPNDFYNYLSKATETDTDGNKITGYQKDLSKLSDADYLNRELLDAWLMFTGGSYKDLITMAVNEDKVRQLKVKSKETKTSRSIKVIKKPAGKVDVNDILL